MDDANSSTMTTFCYTALGIILLNLVYQKDRKPLLTACHDPECDIHTFKQP